MPTKKTSTKKKAVKKVTKKAPAKKVTKATKKTSAKKNSAKKAELVIALPDNAFWVNDGSVLHSLLDLADQLSMIDSDVFKHHVNSDKHDFAEWVEHVLLDADCAEALRRTKAPKSARTVVVTHLKRYSI